LLFIGSCAGVFYALDKNTGETRWSYLVNNNNKVGFHGNPLIAEDLVIVGTDINGEPSGVGYIYAFEAQSGKVRWKVPAQRGIASDLIRVGSSVYGVTLGDEIIAVDLNSGARRWSFSSESDRSDRIPLAPVASKNRIYFGDRDGGIYALHARTGEIIWKRQLTTPVSTSLVAVGESVYLGAANYIYRINQETGSIEGRFMADGWSFGKPVVTSDSIILFINDTLTSLDLSLKDVRWRQRTTSTWTSPRLHLWGKAVLAGVESGTVLAFRTTDGARQWSCTLEGIIRSIGRSEEVLYIGTKRGTIYAYQVQRGNH
jgi:outer membrane protein assembly factor BamB